MVCDRQKHVFNTDATVGTAACRLTAINWPKAPGPLNASVPREPANCLPSPFPLPSLSTVLGVSLGISLVTGTLDYEVTEEVSLLTRVELSWDPVSHQKTI